MEVYQIEDDDLVQIEQESITDEKELENYLARSEGATIGGVDVLYIGKQKSPRGGGIFDLTGVDKKGDVVIIELKRGESPRDVVAQALEYAASLRKAGYSKLNKYYDEFADNDNVSLKQKHSEFFNREQDPLSEREYNTEQRLLLVGQSFNDLVLEMSDFLRANNIDVICVGYSSFATENGLQLLTTESVRRPLSEEPNSTGGEEPHSRDTIIRLVDEDNIIKKFEESTQTDAMENVVDYLIENYNLLTGIDIPYVPGDEETITALINDTPKHIDGSEMERYRELECDKYLFTNLSASRKKKHLRSLADECDIDIEFDM